jgi:hypothetical protein
MPNIDTGADYTVSPYPSIVRIYTIVTQMRCLSSTLEDANISDFVTIYIDSLILAPTLLFLPLFPFFLFAFSWLDVDRRASCE